MESFFGIDPGSPSFYSNMPTNTVFGSSTGATTPKGMDPATLALGLGSSVIGGIGSAIAGDQAAAAAERANAERELFELREKERQEQERARLL